MTDGAAPGMTDAARAQMVAILREAVGQWPDRSTVPDALRSILTDPDGTEGAAAATAPDLALHDAWNGLGDILFNQASDGFLLAEHAYRLAIASSPAGIAAWRGLGECLTRRRLLAEAQSAHDIWFRGWIGSEQSAALRRHQDAARTRGLPGIMLVAMQKSASEFIRDALMRILDLPLIYASIGAVPVDRLIPAALRQLAGAGAICRCHASAGENLAAMAAAGIGRLVLHVRDPRQVVVSWAHMKRGSGATESRYSAYMYAPPVPDDFAAWSFEQQLAWSIAHYLPGQIGWLEGWAAALDSDPPVKILVTTYEDFYRDRVAYFERMLSFLGIAGVDPDAFAAIPAQSARNFRTGRPDEWREVLSPAQAAAAWQLMADVAPRFGWRE
jgi:hypothetical protein